jgi:hypothetical protein
MEELIILINTSPYSRNLHYFEFTIAITENFYYVLLIGLALYIHRRLSKSVKDACSRGLKILLFNQQSKQEQPQSLFVLIYSFFNKKWHIDALYNHVISQLVLTWSNIAATKIEPVLFLRFFVGIIMCPLYIGVFLILLILLSTLTLTVVYLIFWAKLFVVICWAKYLDTHRKFMDLVDLTTQACIRKYSNTTQVFDSDNYEKIFHKTFEEVNKITVESAMSQRDLTNIQFSFWAAIIILLIVGVSLVLWHRYFLLPNREDLREIDPRLGMCVRILSIMLVPERWSLLLFEVVCLAIVALYYLDNKCFSVVSDLVIQTKSLTLKEGLILLVTFVLLLMFVISLFF